MHRATARLASATEVAVERSFAAPAARVWQAYTEPDLVRRWLLGLPGWEMPVCEMDVRVGGRYRWRWRSVAEGKEFGFSGTFQKVEPCSALVHTQSYAPGDLHDSMGKEDSLVTVELHEAGGATTVTTAIRFASQADRDAAFSTGMTDGMEQSYQLLDRLLAT